MEKKKNHKCVCQGPRVFVVDPFSFSVTLYLSVLIPDCLVTFCYSVSFSFVSGLLALMLWEPRRRPFPAFGLCEFFFAPLGSGGVGQRKISRAARSHWVLPALPLGRPRLVELCLPPRYLSSFCGGQSRVFWDQMRRGEKGIPGGGQSSGQALKLYFMLSRLSQVLSVAIHLASINKE